jgi:hypothetical protein
MQAVAPQGVGAPHTPYVRPSRYSRRGGGQPIAPASEVTVRSVVGPRPLGSVSDLLSAPALHRVPRQEQPAAEPSEHYLEQAPVAEPVGLTNGEYAPERYASEGYEVEDGYEEDYQVENDQEDYLDEPEQLWRRGLAMCRPRRVLTVAAIAAAVLVGAGGWQQATAPSTPSDGSAASAAKSSSSAGTKSTAKSPAKSTAKSTARSTATAHSATRVDNTAAANRAGVLPG